MRSEADAGPAHVPAFVYIPGLAALHGEHTFSGDEAHYLARVVRVRAGERVTATDGAGLVASLAIVGAHAREVIVRPEGAARRVASPAPLRILVGPPEEERGDWMVEKLAELGVTDLVPVDTSRVRWPASARGERWERLAIAALRQSRSAWRMRIAVPMPLDDAVVDRTGTLWLADPEGRPIHSLPAGEETPITAAVGPSSGFSPDERNRLLECGFVRVSLARNRLRTETAALAIAAAATARRAGSSGEP